MALNRSVGAAGVVKKGSNPLTKASGIPSATKVLKSCDHSLESSHKATAASQLADGRATSGTSPKTRSNAREKGLVTGRTVPSGGGTGVDSSAKPNLRSAASSSVSVHSTSGGNVPGRLPTKIVAKDRSGRSSPKLNGLPDVSGVATTELRSKPDATLHTVHVSSLPQSTASTSLRVDKTGTKPTGPVAQTKAGMPVVSSTKRLSSGSIGGKSGMPSGVVKGKSPPLSSAVNSEMSAKTEPPKVRKATGIAKLQNHPSSARSATGTATRSRGLPGLTSTLGNARASGSVRTAGSTDLNANQNNSDRDRDTARRDVRTKSGHPAEKLDNAFGTDKHSTLMNHKNLGIIAGKHKLPVKTNRCANITENQIQKIPVHASQDFISKTFEESVEDTSECEYFSETRSTVSENLSDFADGGLTLDLTVGLDLLGPVNLSDLRQDAEGNIKSLSVSMDDVFASCEDILRLSEDAVGNGPSKTSDHSADPSVEQNSKPELMEESFSIRSFDALPSHVDLAINEDACDHDLQVAEDDYNHDLQIIEDGDYGSDAQKNFVDFSAASEHGMAADIPETSSDGITVGKNETVSVEVDSQQARVTAGNVFLEKSEAILNNSSDHSLLKEADVADTLIHKEWLGCIDEQPDQAYGEDKNQPLQAVEKIMGESLSTEGQKAGDEVLGTVDTMTPGVDQELRIVDGKLLEDLDLGVDGAANVAAEFRTEGVTMPADALEPGKEDATAFKAMIEDASLPVADLKMRVEDAAVADDGQELRRDDATIVLIENKCRGCDSSGFGADGITDSDVDGNNGPPITEAGINGGVSTPTEASAAAAEGGQAEACSAINKDDGDPSRSFLGDSCETLKCDYESDVDPDLSTDMDGVSASGSGGSCCVNQVCECSIVIQASESTDVAEKNLIHINNEVISKTSSDSVEVSSDSVACFGGKNEIRNPIQSEVSAKSRCLDKTTAANFSIGSCVEVAKSALVEDCSIAQDKILTGSGSGHSGDEQPPDDKCQDVDRGGGLLSVRNCDITVLKNNYCSQEKRVVSDTKSALRGKGNNTSYQDGKDCQGTNICLPGTAGQLSSSFINEFSAWLATEAVTDNKSSLFDPGVSQLERIEETDCSSAFHLNGSSVIAKDTMDVKVVVVAGGSDDIKFVDDVEEFDDGDARSEEKHHNKENLDSNYKVQDSSFVVNSIHQQETVVDLADSVPKTYNADITGSSTGLPGKQCSVKAAMPQQSPSANFGGINLDQLAAKFVQMAGGAADLSVNLPKDQVTPKNNDNKNENLVQNEKTDECVTEEAKVIQIPYMPVLDVVSQATLSNKVVTCKQNESDPHPDKLGGQEGVSADGAKKREPLPRVPRPNSSRASLPASLTHSSMMTKLSLGLSAKGMDSSIHRGPSPLSVLTDRPVDDNSKDGCSSQNLPEDKATVPSDIPLLSVRRFRPITVQDYFKVNSSNSLNAVEHESSEQVTNDKQVDTRKLIKDANHNVVTTAMVSTGDGDIRPPASEIAGFLSPRYVPSRPLSQICSRTMGNSLRRNIGCGDGDNTSLTSVESLPTVDSSGNTTAKPNILAQIRFARSCSRIGLKSPMPSEGYPEHACSTPRLPVAGSLPSFDLYHSSSGRTLAPSTPFSVYSRTDSSHPSQCSTPVVGDWPSPCTTPTKSTGFEPSCFIPSRNATPRLSRHQTPDEDVHGSFVSLASVSSSVFSSSAEEKQAIELRKLKLELEAAKETIVSLKTQLNVNALMSKTYEQNIEGMTQRLKQLTTIIDQKESELCELRSALKNISSSDGGGGGSGGLHTIPDCVSVGSSFHRRSSNSASLPHDARTAGLRYLPVLTRHISCESVNSLNSQSSSCSMGSQQSASMFSEKKKKKKNWIRSSFSKAFSRKKNKPGSIGEPDSLSLQSDTSANEPFVIDSQTNVPAKSSPPEGLTSQIFPDSSAGELEKRLHEADMELTELRLEQLASIQNIEHLQEKINLLEQQVATLKAENKSLQRLLLHQGASPSTPATSLVIQKKVPTFVRKGSLHSSSPGTPLPSSYSVDGLSKLSIPTSHEMSSPKLLQRFSLVDAMASDASYEQLRRICVYVSDDACELHGRRGTSESEEKTNDKASRQIGLLMLSEQASWLELDLQIGNLFVEHIHHLDPETGLGLDERSIASYRLGSQERIPNSNLPDSLPSKNLPVSNACIKIRLRDWQEDSVDFLAFDTLVPKPFLHQYVSLLLENRRLLFCGPNLSGKTFLAKKLARHLVLRREKKLSSISIAQFTVDSKSSKELQQYLSNIVSHCEQASDRLPSVIVIDNLHLADNLSKAFSGFFSLDSQSCPYLIGTMTQSRAASITCLQFHQNFRWVLFGQTDEPVKSFLARYLHRQWAEKHFWRSGGEDGDCGLLRVVDWMPKVWHHVNRFVALLCSPDKCIGPGIFLPCPMDMEKAKAWFVDLWNHSIGPYLLQLIKDSSAQGGFNKSTCDDPTDWVLETSPWENSKGKGPEAGCLPLLRLYPYQDASAIQEQNQVSTPGAKPFSPNSLGRSDPLLDMLLHLQVATCYADSVSTSTNNLPSRSFSGVPAVSKISAAPSSLHSAAL